MSDVFQRDVADGIHRIEDSYTNWYLVEGEDGGVTIVDTGLPTSWPSLEDALGRLGRGFSDVRAVVLTHAHFDHLGVAERARRELGVPVWVHENDAPVRPRAGEAALRRHSVPGGPDRRLPRQKPGVVAGAGEGDTTLCERSSSGPRLPEVVFTPGHTLGHCAPCFPERDCVIAGDAVVMLDPYTAKRGPRIVARAATADSERALASLDALAATGAKTALTGHGEPWNAGAERAAEEARRAGVS